MCDLELTADQHTDCTSSLCSTEPHGNQVDAFLQPCLATGSILPNFWANYDQDKQDIPTWAQNVSLAPPPSLPSLPDWPGFPARPSLVLSPDCRVTSVTCGNTGNFCVTLKSLLVPALRALRGSYCKLPDLNRTPECSPLFNSHHLLELSVTTWIALSIGIKLLNMFLDSLLLLEIQSLPTLDSRVQEHFILTFSSSL